MQTSRYLTHTRSATLYAVLRAGWSRGIHCPSDIAFAFGVSLVWGSLYNLRFWQQTIEAMWHPSLGAASFMVSLFVLVLSVQGILLLLMPTRLLMRAAASALFIVAAAGSYFCSEYGAIMNKDMMRNVLQTDPAEIGGLLNLDLIAHLLVLGIAPAVLVWRIALPSAAWSTQLRQRLVFIVGALLVSISGLFACSADYAVFFREHKPIRFSLSPAAPVSSTAGLMADGHGTDVNRPLLDPAGNVQRVGSPHVKPLVLFLVIGETARAANFQLGGYTRETNPRLHGIDDLVYFDQTSSCGTSTAIAVPCMFSHFGRSRFDADESDRYTNLLDSLVQAGFDVQWRDNNAGCKGVCARVTQVSYAGRGDRDLCPHSYCYDEIMLADLPAALRKLNRDTVIVFHQIGSHGPAYSERYPPDFEIFKPACRSNQLQRCTPEEIVNAYDNTIAYTDYVVARQIELLRAASDQVDSVLIYASDHGESLGEQGIYLHGMPYSFAPAAQKEVPMMLWTSPGYADRVGLRRGCLRSRAQEALSHDNLYHTVLGATEVRNEIYDAGLDILSACHVAKPADHE